MASTAVSTIKDATSTALNAIERAGSYIQNQILEQIISTVKEMLDFQISAFYYLVESLISGGPQNNLQKLSNEISLNGYRFTIDLTSEFEFELEIGEIKINIGNPFFPSLNSIETLAVDETQIQAYQLAYGLGHLGGLIGINLLAGQHGKSALLINVLMSAAMLGIIPILNYLYQDNSQDDEEYVKTKMSNFFFVNAGLTLAGLIASKGAKLKGAEGLKNAAKYGRSIFVQTPPYPQMRNLGRLVLGGGMIVNLLSALFTGDSATGFSVDTVLSIVNSVLTAISIFIGYHIGNYGNSPQGWYLDAFNFAMMVVYLINGFFVRYYTSIMGV